MTAPDRFQVHQWAGSDPDQCIVCDVEWSDADLSCAPELFPAELAYLDRPEAPESIRERLAAEFAAIDQEAMHGPALGWPETQQSMPDGGAFYRRLADAAVRVLTESALR